MAVGRHGTARVSDGLLQALLELRGEPRRLLLYCSSGPCLPAFESLPFDRVLLVDRCHRQGFVAPKVLGLGMDNNAALRLLCHLGLRVATLLAVNDGCCEGGNYECLYSRVGFGRLMPLLREGSLLVTDHLRLGHGSPFRVEPAAVPDEFERIPTWSGAPLLRGRTLHWQPRESVEWQGTSHRVRIVHDSVWSHLMDLDVMILTPEMLRNPGHSNFLAPPWAGSSPTLPPLRTPRLLSVPRHSASILEAVRGAASEGHRRIGVLPNFGGHGEAVVRELLDRPLEGVEEVTFFHLDDEDYRWARRARVAGG